MTSAQLRTSVARGVGLQVADSCSHDNVAGASINYVDLNSLRKRLCKKIRGTAYARRHKAALWPDDADVSRIADKFVENRDHVWMLKLISKRNSGKQANSHSGQHAGPYRLDTVRRQISTNRHAEPTVRPDERPVRRLRQAAI